MDRCGRGLMVSATIDDLVLGMLEKDPTSRADEGAMDAARQQNPPQGIEDGEPSQGPGRWIAAPLHHAKNSTIRLIKVSRLHS